MNLTPRGLLSFINYGDKAGIYRDLFDKLHSKTFELFATHRINSTKIGAFHLPEHWSPTVANTMRRMLELDPELKFVDICERFGKLKFEFISSSDKFEVELMDLVHKAQNKIDNINHNLVYRILFKDSIAVNDYNKWLLMKGVLHIGS